MRIHNLYTDANGESHFRDIEIEWAEERRGSKLSKRLPAAGIIFRETRADNDLDWGAYDGPDGLRTARRGLLEPAGPPLGPEALTTADVVLVPGIAVGSDGLRLGRGGGSYDRALDRVPDGTFVCVLLNSEEVMDSVPRDDHDRSVTPARCD